MGLGAALSIGGSILGGIGKRKKAKAQQQAYEASAQAYDTNAELSLKNAALVRQMTQIQVTRKTREGIQIRGATKAGYAAAGVKADVGSALETLSANAKNIALDISLIKKQGEVTATGYEGQAADARAQAAAARAGASSAGFAKTAATIGTGFNVAKDLLDSGVFDNAKNSDI